MSGMALGREWEVPEATYGVGGNSHGDGTSQGDGTWWFREPDGLAPRRTLACAAKVKGYAEWLSAHIM